MTQNRWKAGKWMLLGSVLATCVALAGLTNRLDVAASELGQKEKNSRDSFPLSVDEIKKTLAELSKPSANPDAAAKEKEAALQKLKAYRFLCGVPYKHLKLDDKYNAHCEAAAKICDKLGRLDHNPPNPGLPEDEYKLGLEGAQKSNLAAAFPKANLIKSLDMWMDDSDAGNIVMLGHRRWCLNPTMGKTGFGRSGPFSSMWTIDFSHQPEPFDFICYPARGFMPVEYFAPTFAWCVSLNPKKYQIADDKAVDVKIFPVNPEGKKSGEALALNYKSVSRVGAGIPLCIIFRPDKSAVAAGKRYDVEVSGVMQKDAKAPAVVYPVEFVSLGAGPAK